MKPTYFSFRWHHFRRKLSRSTQTLRQWFSNYVDRHIYGAWQKLGLMRWQFAAWVAVIVISLMGVLIQIGNLDRLWLHEVPQAGGVYREAIIGRVRQVNPLYIDNTATADVAELVFSKLIRTQSGEIKPDLAQSWTISSDRRTYTFILRSDVRWHDGSIFSAKDVAFTFRTLQSPDSRSLLAASWDKVVVNAVDDRTVQFILPSSYSGFIDAITQVGILPEYSLANVKQSQLRLDDFNRQPNGTGPFILERLEANSEVVTLRRNPDYFDGAPLLDRIQLVQYDDVASAVEAYAKQRIDGISKIDANRLADITKFRGLQTDTFRLPTYVGLFYNTARPVLADAQLRRDLSSAIDRKTLVREVMKDQANVAQFPIPAGYLGFNPSAARIPFQPEGAQKALSGRFQQRLRLVTANTGEYPEIARRVSEAWRKAGVPVDVIELDSYSLQQNYIRPRQYDILLYGQDVGGDSDMYSFWHSSQATDPGLNLSSYKNPTADGLLEQARFGKDPVYRDQKYREWMALWAQDTPALLLYSPYYLYAHSVDLTGVNTRSIVTPSDRLRGSQLWAVRSKMAPYKQSR